MNLQLFIKDRLIASVPIKASYLSYPPYLPSLKSELNEKHKEVINAMQARPTYYISTNASHKNKPRSAGKPLL